MSIQLLAIITAICNSSPITNCQAKLSACVKDAKVLEFLEEPEAVSRCTVKLEEDSDKNFSTM